MIEFVMSIPVSADDQLCQYPGLTRGLVAVLLYYDGQRCLVQVNFLLLDVLADRKENDCFGGKNDYK